VAYRGGVKAPLSIKGRSATIQSNVMRLAEPGTFVDEPADVSRNGARRLLMVGGEAKVADFLGQYSHLVTEEGR
jgi:hypothetical protein